MNILITAGNTQTPIDRVRCITNIFSGRTGTNVAREARRRGHSITLLTSHPELAQDFTSSNSKSCSVRAYRTFDDLECLMQSAFRQTDFDAAVHCAAVSDFHVAGVYSLPPETSFDAKLTRWQGSDERPHLINAVAGKVKSRHEELWLRLTPTPKLIDKIRSAWGFEGVLCKFKLEVDVGDDDLLEIAECSRRQSRADMICANTLSGMQQWAYLGGRDGAYYRVSRELLAASLLNDLEALVASTQTDYFRQLSTSQARVQSTSTRYA